MKIILLGAPGCGKGSLAKKIVNDFSVVHISTGDLFREAIKKDDEFANEIKSIISSGQYVPDKITNKIATDAIVHACEEKKGFILDGYPRTIDQANYLKQISEIDYVLYLKIDTNILLDRITGRMICPNCGLIYNVKTFPKPKINNICDQCGVLLIQRKDDNLDVAKERIQIYYNQTQPVIDYYQQNQKLVIINANQPLDKVYVDVLNIINK